MGKKGGGGKKIGPKKPLKTIITFCLEMNNKLLTWKKLRKRGFQGPSICILSKSSDEQSLHLSSCCPYAGDVWTMT